MRVIFGKRFMIIMSFITMIAGMCIYYNDNNLINTVQYVVISIFTLKLAYVNDNWRRGIKYRRNNINYILSVVGSLLVSMILILLAFSQPVLYERMDSGITNAFLHMIRAAVFIVLCFIFCLTINFDKKIEAKTRSSIKCSLFEECSRCYSTSCMNCKSADEENISVSERIKIELIKDDKYYSKKLENSFERLIKQQGRESDVSALEDVLKEKYKEETYHNSFLKHY
ncbi:MAG: hypothetical protein Q4F66_00755 [Clostridium sp.]|nr:hypothetical protein [Clostridium sp.]